MFNKYLLNDEGMNAGYFVSDNSHETLLRLSALSKDKLFFEQEIS